MAVNNPEEDKFSLERELGYNKLNNCNAGQGMLLEIILYHGTNIIRTSENEITTFADDDMKDTIGERVCGYLTTTNVFDLKPTRWFRLEQFPDGSPGENNRVDVDYATVHTAINHFVCGATNITSKP